MNDSKPSDAAMRAADRLYALICIRGNNFLPEYPGDTKHLEQLAKIIDERTGLKELIDTVEIEIRFVSPSTNSKENSPSP